MNLATDTLAAKIPLEAFRRANVETEPFLVEPREWDLYAEFRASVHTYTAADWLAYRDANIAKIFKPVAAPPAPA